MVRGVACRIRVPTRKSSKKLPALVLLMGYVTGRISEPHPNRLPSRSHLYSIFFTAIMAAGGQSMAHAKAFIYIRFSSPEQAKGRSLDRQTEASNAYAVKENLELDERSFKDLGVSAFKGRNIQEGALGLFLEAVREGAIPKGSYLLVESLDRVSRQAAYDAVDTIKAIVSEGITVVDLSDSGRIYNAEVLRKDPMAFLMMIVRFMRANEESQRKSERIADTWKKKRSGANNNVPMTSNAPAWLKLNPDKKSYSAIPDRALIVK